MNSSSTLIEHHSSHADIQLHFNISRDRNAEPQENSSHKTQDQQPLVHQNLQWKSVSGKVVSQGVARYRKFHNFESLKIQYYRMNNLLTNLEIFCHHNYGSVAYSSLYEAQASQVHPLCSLRAIHSTVLSAIFQLHFT